MLGAFGIQVYWDAYYSSSAFTFVELFIQLFKNSYAGFKVTPFVAVANDIISYSISLTE